jgi:hypothetical protein
VYHGHALTLIPTTPAAQLNDILALEPDVLVRLTRPDAEPELFHAGRGRGVGVVGGQPVE